MVYNHYNKSIYAIIDEVDAPLNGLYGYLREINEILSILNWMFKVAFKNDNL